MAIFGFKKRKDEKLEQNAQVTKSTKDKKVSNKPASSVNKNTKKTEKVAVSKVISPVLKSDSATSSASVIVRPRVTEKSGVLSQGGVYTFEVSDSSNKTMIKKAFVALYKVSPVQIKIINSPEKNVFVRGRRGVVSGMKKAIITVKKGEKIDFV
jgi:large subunit ribosomal protein L23